MKTTLTLIVNITLFVILILLLVQPYFNQPVVSAQGSNTLALIQTTPTPQAEAENVSVIGSTDGILAMGIVIVLIVTLPLLFRKKGK